MALTLTKDDIFNDSYERVLSPSDPRNRSDGGFFDTFYRKFLASSPRVADAFKHTDMTRQIRVLSASLHLLMACTAGQEPSSTLKDIAIIHSKKQRNITPDLYDIWMMCLLETVADYDPEFDEKVADAWLSVLKPGIDYMKSMYDV